jgi:hypothetical protein
MHLLDPINSLLDLFNNPTLEQQALIDFDQDMQPLANILDDIIEKYIDTVTNRNQAKIVLACIVLRSNLGWLLTGPNTKTGWGE